MTDYFAVQLPPEQIRAISSIGLAHLGDAVFELLVRTWLCAGGKATGRGLHRAVHLVVLQQIVELALGVRAHGTELVQPEQLAVAAHPQLAEHRACTRAVDPDCNAGKEHQRRKHHQRQQRKEDILCAAHTPVGAVLMKIRLTVDRDRLADAKLCAGLLHPTGLQPVFRFWRSGYSCHT